MARLRTLQRLGLPALVAGLAALSGCNMVLGIDEANLDEAVNAAVPDASVEASPEAAGSDSTGPSVCAKSGEPCWDCTATKCCAEYAACESDPACTSTMATYNDCLKSPPTGGETCAEQAAGQNSKFLALSNCAFLEECFGVCGDRPVGNMCGPYCECMAETCPDKTFGGSTCAEACPSLTVEQIQCRGLHCTFAKGNPIHCDHAAGEDICP